MSTRTRHRLLGTYVGLLVFYLLAPVAVMVVFSFNASESLMRLDGLSLRWYETFFADERLVRGLWISLGLALVTVLVSAVIGTLMAFGLARSRMRGKSAVEGAMLLPMITPDILLAVAMLMLFTQAFLWKPGLLTVAIGHVTLGLVYMTVAVRARLVTIGRSAEEAARDLGASPGAAISLVVMPQLWPTIVTSGLLIFAVSLDDFSISLFNSGQGNQPLPVLIWSMLRFGVTPEINAAGTVICLLTLLTLTAFLVARRRQGAGARMDGFGDAF